MKKLFFAALALIVVMASCVKDPKYPGVTISNVKYTPTAVQDGDVVTVTAEVGRYYDVIVKLVYTVNEGNEEIVAMQERDDNVFWAEIPGQADGVKVTFHIIATGEKVMTTTTPDMEYTVGAVAIDYSVLRLNELNGNDKFIEIYNSGNETMSLKGVYIEKDGTQNWVGAETVYVEAGGYLVLYSEDVALDHEGMPESLFFHSGLSAKKNVRIQMFTPSGENIDDFNLTNIDANDPAYIPAPASYSRNADGKWYYSDATPGEVNVDGTVAVLGLEGGDTPEPPTPEEPDYTNLVLNELNGDTKFIEFYNKGNLDLSMEGMFITKDGNEEDIKWTGDATHVVPAHGYLVLYSIDTQLDHPELGENMFFNSGLSAKKTVRIALYMADGTERDIFTRGSTGEWGQTISNVAPISSARTPDGGDWKLAEATPGAANPVSGEDIPQE